MKYVCEVCGWVYDEDEQGVKWEDPPDDFACELCGVEAKTVAMRGGTDGSYISTQGIITPNYFTGALNFHSSCEFMPLSAVEKSTQVTLALVDLIAGTKH